MSIRTRLILTVVPLLAVGIIITASLTALEAVSGMTSLTIRLLVIKSGALSWYMEDRWKWLLDNRLSEHPEGIEAVRRSIAAFALTLIHSQTELIFAIDPAGRIVLATEPVELTEKEASELLAALLEKGTGRVKLRVGGVARIGEAIRFDPFDWNVLILEERSALQREMRAIVIRAAIVLAGMAAAAAAFLSRFSRRLTRPIGVIVRTIDAIVNEQDFSGNIEVKPADEIGDLAARFNLMVSKLRSIYEQVRERTRKEAVALTQVIEREYETLLVLGKAAEYKDPETATHIARVGLYSRLLARHLGEDEDGQNLLLYASPLHDIGKMGIPDSILLKPGRLTAEEFDIIKTHTTIAYDILKDSRSPYLRAGAEIALTHHEWFNGTGYPKGLRGEAIPLFGRIVGLADAFDAVTSKRPYKERWSLDKAFGMLRSEKGTHFDPRLVEVFLKLRAEIRKIYESH